MLISMSIQYRIGGVLMNDSLNQVSQNALRSWIKYIQGVLQELFKVSASYSG